MSQPQLNEYIIDGDGVLNVRLGVNLIMTIDSEDKELIDKHRWMISRSHNVDTVITFIDKTTVSLGRLIAKRMGLDIKDMYILHKDGNRLNNRRNNLSLATMDIIQQNRKVPSTNQTGFKGVFYDKTRRKWVATITKSGVSKRKRFDLIEEAVEWRKNEESS